MSTINGNPPPSQTSPAMRAPTDNNQSIETKQQNSQRGNPGTFGPGSSRSALKQADNGQANALLGWVSHIFDRTKGAVPGSALAVNSRVEPGGNGIQSDQG